MKLVVMNQNYSQKIYGKDKDAEEEYLVKFETELSYFWIRGIYLSNFQRNFTPIGGKLTFLSDLWGGTVAEWSKALL